MSLATQIENARRRVVTDGYEMSIGELISLYKDKEVIINPEFQRLFRWELFQKTRFIESLLLGIPIPPIFVFQTEKGVWELVDGLQRLSTILEFVGELLDSNGNSVAPSVLEGTKLLPSLADKRWKSGYEDDPNEFTITQQLQIRRARLRVEILKMESDSDAKYELFQRLNTGGSILSPQEVRNCVMVMSNSEAYRWLRELIALPAFVDTVQMTETARSEQKPMEMALRFFAYRNVPYDKRLDVNEYLDESTITLSKLSAEKQDSEGKVFLDTFDFLNRALGSDAFKKWDGAKHSGGFLVSGFDVIATGLSKRIDEIRQMELSERNTFIAEKVRAVWINEIFLKNSGMGVRGTTRLVNLLPLSDNIFK